MSDGTFSVQPAIFSQFYVFHAPYLKKVIPLIFCLLPNKTYSTNCRLFEIIKNEAKMIGTSFEPKKIHIDYEAAMIKAVSNVFSSKCVQGCLFHYCQCLWRKVQELGLSVAYRQHRHVKQWIRRYSALPLLPVDDVEKGFFDINENAPVPSDGIITQKQIDDFSDYILETWVHDTNAKFNREIWNQFSNEGPRTTNNAEGWHNKLNQQAKSRQSLFQFVHFLQGLQVDLDSTKFDLISESPSRQSARYNCANETLKVAKENYSSGNVPLLLYLDSVSVALKLD